MYFVPSAVQRPRPRTGRRRSRAPAAAVVGIVLLLVTTIGVGAGGAVGAPTLPRASHPLGALSAPPSGSEPKPSAGPVARVAIGPAANYSVTFTEFGLKDGILWWVNLSAVNRSSTTNSIAFARPDGTYNYSIGTTTNATPDPRVGQVDVNGTPLGLGVQFATFYSVSFEEVDLPYNLTWSVHLTNGTGGRLSVAGTTTNRSSQNISIWLSNGTYDYAVVGPSNWSPTPATGVEAVNHGGPKPYIQFALVTFLVEFYESGLPYETNWSVAVAGTTLAGTGSTLRLDLQNGSYAYTVGAIGGYVASPSSGDVKVDGRYVNQTIGWSPALFAVLFQENGLPAGTLWGISIGTFVNHSSTGSVVVSVPNGSYRYTVLDVPGYVAQPDNGTMTINGAAPAGLPTIVFTAAPSNSSGGNGTAPSGFAEDLGPLLLGLGVLGAILAIVAVVLERRDRRTARAGPPPPPAGT